MGLIYALNTSLLYVFSHKWRGLSNCRQYDFARFIIGKFCVYESFSPHCNQSLLLARSLSLSLSDVSPPELYTPVYGGKLFHCLTWAHKTHNVH